MLTAGLPGMAMWRQPFCAFTNGSRAQRVLQLRIRVIRAQALAECKIYRWSSSPCRRCESGYPPRHSASPDSRLVGLEKPTQGSAHETSAGGDPRGWPPPDARLTKLEPHRREQGIVVKLSSAKHR